MKQVGEREVIYKGSKFDLERVSATGHAGAVMKREVIRHPGAVCILPILNQGERASDTGVVMTRQVRVALGKEIWELPAGTLEKDEDPAKCASRELIEEAGYRAESMIPLGSFYTTPGMTDELMRSFVATGLAHVGQQLEPYETIRVEIISAREVFSLIAHGELMDAKSMVTINLAARRGFLGQDWAA